MILIELEVPAIGKRYDFRLEENVYIADLIDEIGVMMYTGFEQEEQEKMKDVLLCEYDSKRILPLDRTLKQCGIGSGARLVFL